METKLSRVQGCLLDQLAGDALGSLVEVKSPDVIWRSYPEGVRELANVGTWNTIAGQWLDSLQNCRPESGHPRVRDPRPKCFWPVDVLALAEGLSGI